MSAFAMVAAALVLAAPASSHEDGPVLIIRHQMRGCHGSDQAREGDRGLGLVDFAVTVHVDREGFNTTADVEKWASGIPVPTYALDDQTAVKVTDGNVDVVSEGNWRLFTPNPVACGTD